MISSIVRRKVNTRRPMMNSGRRACCETHDCIVGEFNEEKSEVATLSQTTIASVFKLYLNIDKQILKFVALSAKILHAIDKIGCL